MLLPAKAPIDHVDVSSHGLVTGAPDDWCAVRFQTENAGERWALMPGPEFSPRVYRGQNKRYERTVASLFRQANETEWFAASVQILEFGLYVMNHPGTVTITERTIGGLKGFVDWTAQGQHYGIPTEYLDVTRNREVAEFFARCRPTVDSDPTQPWEVVPESGYDAVLYTVDLKQLINSSDSDIVAPMGPSPLPRAYRQAAAGLRLKGTDFCSLPSVTQEMLPYSRERAETLLTQFEGGAFLFPNDGLSRIARAILTDKIFTADAVKAARRMVGRPFSLSEISTRLSKAGYRIIKTQPKIDANLFNCLRAEWDEMATEYDSRIKWRWTSSHYVQ